MDNSEYKSKVLRELMRYHEHITEYYAVTEPHTKVESDLYMYLEDVYRDVVHVVRWGDTDEKRMGMP